MVSGAFVVSGDRLEELSWKRHLAQARLTTAHHWAWLALQIAGSRQPAGCMRGSASYVAWRVLRSV